MRDAQHQHQDQEGDGKTQAGATPADSHLLDPGDGGRDHHRKQRANVDQQQHITRNVGRP